MINFTPIVLERLKVLRELSPDLSFGDILYSILRDVNLQADANKNGICWLRAITDEQYYKAIERLIIEETEFKSDNYE